MGLFEIIGEWISPAPSGGIGLREQDEQLPSFWIVLARTAIAIAGLGLLLARLGAPFGLGGIIGCLAYVVAGAMLRPDPDYSNVGWLGGLMDDPFHISDDFNRFLIFLLVVLWPGRIIGGGFILLFRWLRATSSAAR